MSSAPKVALIGATGQLGGPILSKLLAANFHVTIVTRQGSSSTKNLPSHSNQTIREVDYSSKDSLVSAFEGNDVVISTIASAKTGDQNLLVDSAVAAGVKRFIPSDFGSDIFHPKNINLPVFAGKIATQKHLEETAKANPDFTYTSIYNGPFFDWGLQVGFLISPKNHTATLWNGGDVPFSVTTLSTIADAVVAVVNNPAKTANKVIKIHDAIVTQNQLIAITKKIDGKEWEITEKSTDDAEAEGYAELKKENPDFGKAMVNFLMPAVFGKGREIYASQVENGLLGLGTFSDEQVEQVVKNVLQA